jgi:hypothetical protein
MTTGQVRSAARPDVGRYASIPRDVRLTANGVAMLVLAVLFAAGAVAAGIGLSIAYARQRADRELLQRDGVAADAVVVRIAQTRGEHRRRIVTYRFAVDGSAYAGHVTLRERDRRPLAVGSALGIRYLSSDPARSWMDGYEPDVLPPWVIPPSSLSLLLVAWLLARAVMRQRLLLSEGRLADARVVASKRVARQHHHGYRVTYEFRALSGAMVTAASETRRRPPEIGTRISVVYHREDPRWNAVYPLSLVRPAKA